MQRRKVCRYFQRGSCKKEKCPFVHMHQTKKNCEFHMKGVCRKGANCNFYHPPKQTNEQKEVRKNFKEAIKKQKPKQHMYKEEQVTEQKDFEEEEGEVEDAQDFKKQQFIKEQQEEHEQVENEEIKMKEKRMAMILGLSESEEEEESEQQMTQQPVKKLRPLNLNKIHPKKFPDYSKTAEFKLKIKENEQRYFKGKKFMQFLNSLHDPNEKQYYQIIRKFQDSFQLQEQIEGSGITEYEPRLYRIKLRPLLYSNQIHLHFQMVEDAIQIQIDSRNYPEHRSKFQIMNYSIPQEYRQKLVNSLTKIHEKKSVFETLKTFMNNFQKIYNLAKSKLEDEYFSQIELQKKIDRTLSRQTEEKQSKKKRVKKIKKQQAQMENPDVIVEKFAPSEKINVGNMNYDILVQSLFIQNCEYALVDRILLYLECICEKPVMHILEADRKEMKIGVKLHCRKCSIAIHIALQREVMQLRSTLVGKLGIDNGRLLQVGGISWRIGCQCDEEIVKNRLYLSGQRLNTNCHLCFKSMQVHYMGLKFFNPFLPFNITEQKELPNRGACKHMKLSFRWVRYGCCGRMFSCDQCHIRGSIFPHEKIEGTTMLCGFCSVEGPLNKDCTHCKKQLVRGVDKSGHWQGGMGCRDQTLLSRKDAKKYSGLTKKK